jgi:hypothetical protein
MPMTAGGPATPLMDAEADGHDDAQPPGEPPRPEARALRPGRPPAPGPCGRRTGR